MTNRREFIQRGVALSAAAPLVLGPTLGLAADARPRMLPSLAVYDRRYAESLLFARAAEAHGIATHGIDGDVTALWYDDLYHRWGDGASPIVGLTGASSLFCLEHLAWKVERRVVLRIEHSQRSDGRVAHEVSSAASLPGLVHRLDGQSAWPLWSAAAIRQLPATFRRGEKFNASATGAAVAGSKSWEEPLVTWAITLKPVA
jgi:hypothetical protein